MTDQDSQACSFQDPETLKDVLELLEKLYNASSLKKSVGQKLVQDVQKYFKDTDKFYQSGSRSEFLSDVFSNAYGIRSTILQNSGTYPKYSSLNDHENHDCVPRALKKCLPKAFAALYFLLFMGSNSLGGIQGGQWKNQNVNGSGGSGTDLHNWLTKEENLSRTLTPGLIKRGFSNRELKNHNDGSTVAPLIKKIIKHDSAGPLQNVFFYLLFACEWDPALLGHAILFIWTFFVQVNKSKDSGFADLKEHKSGDFEKLNGIWEQLKEFLLPLAQGRHGSHNTSLSAVHHNNSSNLFDNIWKAEAFPFYFEWLKENIDNIKKSLQEMLKDSSNWTSANLKNSDSAGPFKYGFVFTDSWNGNHLKSKLQLLIPPLIGSGQGSLGELKECLEKFSSGSSGSSGVTAGGTAGGILGTAGLGAGVAYATNAFGLKDII
ncbi:secreted antigen 1, partial [Babesia divergens]